MEATEYLIGGGAILEAGARASIRPVTVHAALAREGDLPAVALLDFEASSLEQVRRLVLVGANETAASFDRRVSANLMAAGVCELADVVRIVAVGLAEAEVHLFARWAPPAALIDELRGYGIRLVAHNLADLGRVALIAERRFHVWTGCSAA
ncbi:MAG: hypothetical protein DLM50_07390 [Candidatus Meridianibacter frigidus]|nr:MAG: hypothetical protein DLM50_07390 [Candidatus Eremiobacteraeota bacterium]